MFCHQISKNENFRALPTYRCPSVRILSFLLLIAVGAFSFSYSQKSAEAPASSNSQFDGPAELPRLTVASSLADTPAPGRTVRVREGENLQSVLNGVQCGEKIQLQTGTTFQGAFVLPAKNCDDQHWIILRSSAPDDALPREGERITPCYAEVTSLPGRPQYPCPSPHESMATLVAGKGMPALRLADGANHYRIGPGLELTRAPGDGIHYGMLARRQDPTTNGISHVVIDRDWIHGTPTDETVRGIFLGGFTYTAVVDSYINDFHCVAIIGACVDSQAIAGGIGNMPEGPWKIEDNFLEAGAEDIIFGGGPGTVVPADITIRHNHFFKPLTWMSGQAGFVGGVNGDPQKCSRFNTPGYCPFIVKNLFELKNAQRLLFEGNVLENSWPGFSQHGPSILLQAISQGAGGNANATVADITIRYNRAAHTADGISIVFPPSGPPMPRLEARISVHDDVFDDISPTYYNGTTQDVGVAFQVGRCSSCPPLHDVSINHVTMLVQNPKKLLFLGASATNPLENFSFTNNIVSAPGDLAIAGVGASQDCAGRTNTERWETCTRHSVFRHNVLIGASGGWPHENFIVRGLNDVGFVNHSDGRGGDYRLASKSRHKGAATDGRDPGADIDAVEKATAGVL
jgi:hypothetical protein